LEHIVNTKPDETAKVLRVSEKTASSYDKQIAFFEKIWFGGGGNGSAPAPRAGSSKSASAPGSTCGTTRPTRP
jgi:hypothetical protein